jgi:hypothetical protein
MVLVKLRAKWCIECGLSKPLLSEPASARSPPQQKKKDCVPARLEALEYVRVTTATFSRSVQGTFVINGFTRVERDDYTSKDGRKRPL